MQLPTYLGLAKNAEEQLALAFETIGKKHATDIDVLQTCKLLSAWSKDHVENLKLQIEKYGQKNSSEPKHLASVVLKTKMGSLGLLRDLHGLWLMACEVEMCYIILSQAAKALRDKALELMCEQFCEYTNRQKMWLQTKIKTSASQTLVVADS
jgi:hypothetical protein